MLKRKSIKEIIEEFKTGQLKRKRYKTGISALDKAMGGITEGLTVLGGLPGCGKSTLAFQIAGNMCDAGKQVTIYSYEMTGLDYAEKELAKQQMKKSSGEEGEGTLDIVEAMDGVSLEKLIEDIDFVASKNEEAVFIIDYLQLIYLEKTSFADAKSRVDVCVRELEKVALKFHVPIIVISSLSRDAYKKSEIELGAFKESGDIEYSATLIIALEWDTKEIDSDNRRCRIRVLKNRTDRQPAVLVPLDFYPKYAYFDEGVKAPVRRVLSK